MPNKQKKEILHVITNCNDLRKYVEAAKMILENPNLDHQAYEALVVYAEHYNATDTEGKQIRLKAKRFLAEKLPLIVVA